MPMFVPLLACAFGLLPGPVQTPELGQEDAARLAALAEYQARRTALVDRLVPAVCAVMSLKRAGGGSGVIFDPRGWILTNFHVTSRNKVMKIGLPDGKFYLADVIGIDPGGDIALCALRGKGPNEDGTWPHVGLGDSDKLKIGGVCYAMGNPFLLATDFKPTVTIGIVSGIHRYQAGTGPNGRMLVYPDCVQVDTPINPGNSGGPLFDENGLLVGINGRITIRDRGRVNTGVGFAVSVNQIKNFLPDLVAGKHCEHGTMDMNAWSMTDPNTGRGRGVFAQGFLSESVALEAGLRLGDMLEEFCGRRIKSANDLARDVTMLPSGFEVSVGFRQYDEIRSAYGPDRVERFALAPMDTGSSKDPAPNVPDFRERPDFEALERAAAAKEAAEKATKPAAKDDEDEGVGEGADPGDPVPMPPKLPRGWREDWWDELPEDWRKKWRDEVPKDWRKQLPPDLRKKLDPRKPKVEKRDLEREKGLFRYMDAAVAGLRSKLARTVEGLESPKPRRLEFEVTEYRAGKARKPYARSLVVSDADFVIRDKKETVSLAAASQDGAAGDKNLEASLARELALNPMLEPEGLPALLADAWIEGGVFLENRVGFVVALRGPGKRALYVDRDGHFPIGWRYRSFRHGRSSDDGILDCRIVEFSVDESGRMRPALVRVWLDGELLEDLRVLDAEGTPVVGFTPANRGRSPSPSPEVEKRIAPLLSSVVKVYGASGFRGLPGYGTGLVVSDKGHILTWNHVMLTDKGKIRVVLADGSEHRARVITSDRNLGVAMLKINFRDDATGKKLDFRPLAFAKEPRHYAPGTQVVSVGNSFRLAEFDERLSITIGVVVSTVRSDLRLQLPKFPFKGEVLIVDAPSNPGMHGGGCFDLDGNLIGILAPLVESRETNTQLSLVVPAHELSSFVAAWALDDKAVAKRIEEERRARAEHKAVYTGLRLFDTGRQNSPPAYVDRVLRGSPAHKAGLRPDDLIVRINDFPIRTCAEFRRAIRTLVPGETIDVTFKRGPRVDKVSLELEERK